MRDYEIDQLFSRDGDIEPSSGFAEEVMEVLRHEASVPPPIPFPWKFALLGLFACAVVLLIGSFMALITQHSAAPAPIPAATGAIAAATGWIAFALLLSLVSIRLARRITD